MQITDPVADMLTRIRNANTAKHESVDVPASNLKKAIAKILLDEGYIKSVDFIDDGLAGQIKIGLKYTDKGHHRPAPRLQARPACLRRRRRAAQSPEGSRHRNYFHVQGRHDRQGSACEPCRRRSPGIRLVRRVLNNV